MNLLLLNYGLAFIEGFALILSPCILPILPIVLSGALTGGKNRSWGIILGFVCTFALFTLFSRALVEYLGINLDWVRQLAFGLIIVFGIILFSDTLSEKFSLLTQKIGNAGSAVPNRDNKDFMSGLILGLTISLVWVPCGGPILAAAIIQTAVQKTSLQSFFTFFFFALGSVLPMIFIAFAGKKLMQHFQIIKTHTYWLRKVFAIIIIISAAIAALVGPSAAYAPMPAAPNVVLPKDISDQPFSNKLIGGILLPYAAPEIATGSEWINSAPLSLDKLKGKVVLVDFWTYSCINCVRTLPYLNSWYEKYHKDGLVIIGVHTPEFEFEKNPDNIKHAVSQYGIHYPVVIDSQYKTWLNYHNQYWPADYLIDKSGKVVYVHFGEGDYAEAEHNIRVLLGLNSDAQGASTNQASAISAAQTPETYLGYARADNFAISQPLAHDKIQDYTFAKRLAQDQWSLAGEWKVEAEKIISASQNSAIKIHFYASKVYAVMGSSNDHPIAIKVLLNGQPIGTAGGKDVKESILTLTTHALYEIANLPAATSGELELVIEDKEAELYTFTFG